MKTDVARNGLRTAMLGLAVHVWENWPRQIQPCGWRNGTLRCPRTPEAREPPFRRSGILVKRLVRNGTFAQRQHSTYDERPSELKKLRHLLWHRSEQGGLLCAWKKKMELEGHEMALLFLHYFLECIVKRQRHWRTLFITVVVCLFNRPFLVSVVEKRRRYYVLGLSDACDDNACVFVGECLYVWPVSDDCATIVL